MDFFRSKSLSSVLAWSIDSISCCSTKPVYTRLRVASISILPSLCAITDTELTMASNAQKTPLRNGLREVLMDYFWRDPLIVVDTLHQKLNGLPIDMKKNARYTQQIIVTLELILAVRT